MDVPRDQVVAFALYTHDRGVLKVGTKADINITLMDNHVDPTALFFNMTYADENWRKVVNDVRFRQAVSQGINRQEIIDTVYYGNAQMPTLVPSE